MCRMKCVRARLSVIVGLFVAIAASATQAADPAKNLLFFGNSFTIGNGNNSLPSIVRSIAIAAGQTAPNVYSQVAGGQNLGYHITTVNAAGNSSIIKSSLPAGQGWDSTILQDYSTRPTLHSTDGNIPQFRADAKTLYGLVRAQTPTVKAVLFETWARGYGHDFYNAASSSYQPLLLNPNTMQSQLQSSYNLANVDLNTTYGAGTSQVAPVGDGFKYGNFSNVHNSDLYHANNRGELLAGLVIYTTIYHDNVSDINLNSIASTLGITSNDAVQMATWADAVTQTPEPASTALIAGGMMILAARRRRVR